MLLPAIISLEEIKKRIYISHKDKIEILEYNNKITDGGKFKCNTCNHVWNAIVDSVCRGNGCPNCNRIAIVERCKHTYEYVKDFIESKNCKLLSTEYKNVNTKLEILFECGHQNKISFDCFQRGIRCPICGKEKCRISQRRTVEELNEILSKKGIIIIDFPEGYNNRSSKVKIRCLQGHEEIHSLESVLNHGGCKECSFINLSIANQGENGSNWQGGKSSLTSFLKKQIKQWKKDSIKFYNYSCYLCGEDHRFNDVHHLYNFFNIVDDSLSDLNLDKRKNVLDYTNEELFLITNKVLEYHKKYPLGIPLCRAHHKQFHYYYGLVNNTPEQFYEFQQKIKSGEIALSPLSE